MRLCVMLLSQQLLEEGHVVSLCAGFRSDLPWELGRWSLPEPLPLAALLSPGLAPCSGLLLPAAPSVPWEEVGCGALGVWSVWRRYQALSGRSFLQ